MDIKYNANDRFCIPWAIAVIPREERKEDVKEKDSGIGEVYTADNNGHIRGFFG